jgi:hypothetical protein
LGQPRHRSQIADAQLSAFEQRVDQLHATRVGQHAEGLCEVVEEALVREPIQDGRDPLRFDTFDRAAIGGGVRKPVGTLQRLHNRESITAARSGGCRTLRTRPDPGTPFDTQI